MIDHIIGAIIDSLFWFDPPKAIAKRLKPATWTKAIVTSLWNLFLLALLAGAVIAFLAMTN